MNIEIGYMLQKFIPIDILKDYIGNIWLLDEYRPSGTILKERVVPGGTIRIIFILDGALHQTNELGHWERAPVAFVEGVYSKSFFQKIKKLKCIGIDFLPGKFQFFNKNIGMENRRALIPFECMFNWNYEELLEQFEKDSKSCIPILEDFLKNRLSQNSYNSNRISRVVDFILSKNGNVKIDDLATFACLSRRQFRRVFTKTIGIGPKKFSKIIRIENALKDLLSLESFSVSDLAYQYGYYDQSHFTKDFTQVVGLSPMYYKMESNLIDKAYYKAEFQSLR